LFAKQEIDAAQHIFVSDYTSW